MYKYFAKLKDINSDYINRDNFKLLINAQIFEMHELSEFYKNEGKYFGVELDSKDWTFCNFFLYEKKEYVLKKEVLHEMFDRCKFKVESNDLLDEKRLQVDFELNIRLSPESKISYLKKIILELNKNLTNSQYYLLYAKGRETNGYSSWYEFFYLEQIDNEDYTYIFKYLKGCADYVPNFIKEIWGEYFLTKNLSLYCQVKNTEIERMSGLKEADIKVEYLSEPNEPKGILKSNLIEELETSNNVRSDIFNDDGEEIFNYIVSRYPKTQNKAFFSYLYFYLKSNDKIIILGDDSLEYREFIIDKFPIETFSKLQKTTTEKTNSKKNRNSDLFDKYVDEFNKGRKKEEKRKKI